VPAHALSDEPALKATDEATHGAALRAAVFEAYWTALEAAYGEA